MLRCALHDVLLFLDDFLNSFIERTDCHGLRPRNDRRPRYFNPSCENFRLPRAK